MKMALVLKILYEDKCTKSVDLAKKRISKKVILGWFF